VNQAFVVPEHVEAVLASGLRVLAIRRRGEPLVEIRLWIPFAGVELAQGWLLARTMFRGTSKRSAREIAEAVRGIGGSLGADADADRLRVVGRSLESGLDRLLEVLAAGVEEAGYPERAVLAARDRSVGELQVALSDPGQLAGIVLARHIYDGHPYQSRLPEPDRVRKVAPEDLRAVHERFVRPGGSILVVVGDLDPEAMADAAARRLAGWSGSADEQPPPMPALRPGPLLLVDRPGSEQSALRLVLPAVRRGHPDNAALRLANLIFGGYFCSRWTANLRDDKGYTYAPRSAIEESVAGARLIATADVATAVTAPALAETVYELGRIACVPPDPAELDRARRYTVGSLAVLAMSTHRALADLALGLVGSRLSLAYLGTYVDQLAATTVEDVHQAANSYLAPSGAVAVILGDAAQIERSVKALTSVTLADRTPA
jgi:predicted Zn-dependent peptidase